MKTSRRQWMETLPAAAVAAAALARGREARADFDDRDDALLAFSTMMGNCPGTNINGNIGAGLPWCVEDADGLLTVDGELRVRLHRLVFAPGTPDAGNNPVPFFKAIVSCTTVNSNMEAEFFNFATKAFPATTQTKTNPGGDAEIHARISLPEPIFAPIVFIGPAHAGDVAGELPAGTGTTWFAVTGH